MPQRKKSKLDLCQSGVSCMDATQQYNIGLGKYEQKKKP